MALSGKPSIEELDVLRRLEMPDAEEIKAEALGFFTKTYSHMIHPRPRGDESTEFIDSETPVGQRSIGVALFERTVLAVIPKETTVDRLRSNSPRVPNTRAQNLSQLVLPWCTLETL
jgi:hypothetical protein